MPNVLPWFPFYYVDFYSDAFVKRLTRAEQGLYMQLLADQWAEDHIPADVPAIALQTHSDEAAIERLLPKFPLDEDGVRRNKKLDELRRAALKKSKTNRLTAVRAHAERRARRERTKRESESESETTTRSGGASRPQLSTRPEEGPPRRLTAAEAAPPSTSRQGWNDRAADMIRRHCYLNDKNPPHGVSIAEDLKWFRLRLDEGKSEEAIEAALRGAPVCVAELRGKKWSPARMFSKKGAWVNLFDRAVTADGKSGRPRPLSEIMRGANAQNQS